MKIRLFRPYIDEDELNAVKNVFNEKWLGLGTHVNEFEREWSHKFGFHNSVAVNSATAALHLALASFDFPKGKKVLIPALTFSATAMAVLYNDLVPVFVDVEETNLTMDPEDLEHKIDKDCVAVITVHYGGAACDMPSINAIASRFGLKIIEDCAHTQGGKLKDRFLGSFGDIGCFSFEEKKGMTTGDGGMICFKEEQLYQRLKPMRWVGIDKDTWRRKEELDDLTDHGNHWYYEINALGYKYNMNNLAAAIGRSQLKKLDRINETKNNAILRYLHNLSLINIGPDQHLLDYEGSWTGAYWLFGLRVPNRNTAINTLTQKGISTGVHFTPLNQQPFFSKYAGETPKTKKIYPQLLTLPLYPMMTIEEVDLTCEAIFEMMKS